MKIMTAPMPTAPAIMERLTDVREQLGAVAAEVGHDRPARALGLDLGGLDHGAVEAGQDPVVLLPGLALGRLEGREARGLGGGRGRLGLVGGRRLAAGE